MTTPLLPCPFCGAPPHICPFDGGGWQAECPTDSDISGHYVEVTGASRDEVVLAWNTRAAAPARVVPLLNEAAQYIEDNVKGLGGCDHSVGICACADLQLAERLREAALAAQPGRARRRCDQCGAEEQDWQGAAATRCPDNANPLAGSCDGRLTQPEIEAQEARHRAELRSLRAQSDALYEDELRAQPQRGSEAVELLALLYDKWENGVPCTERSDDGRDKGDIARGLGCSCGSPLGGQRGTQHDPDCSMYLPPKPAPSPHTGNEHGAMGLDYLEPPKPAPGAPCDECGEPYDQSQPPTELHRG